MVSFHINNVFNFNLENMGISHQSPYLLIFYHPKSFLFRQFFDNLLPLPKREFYLSSDRWFNCRWSILFTKSITEYYVAGLLIEKRFVQEAAPCYRVLFEILVILTYWIIIKLLEGELNYGLPSCIAINIWYLNAYSDDFDRRFRFISSTTEAKRRRILY